MSSDDFLDEVVYERAAKLVADGKSWYEAWAYCNQNSASNVAPNPDALRKRVKRWAERRVASQVKASANVTSPASVEIPREAKARKLPPAELVIPWHGQPPARLSIDSDLHYPLHHRGFEQAKLKFLADIKPDVHVTAGDMFDFTNLSRYDHDPRFAHSIVDEFEAAHEYVAGVCSSARRWMFIPGNHEERLWKTVMANHALFGLLEDFKHLARFPDKADVFQYGTELQVGNAWIVHGDQTKTQNPTHWRVSHSLARLTLFGHWHRPGSYVRIQRGHDGRMVRREAHSLGHGQDISTVTKWAGTTPAWAMGFAYVEQDGEDFLVHPIIANDKGEFTFNGRRYKG